MSDWFWTLCAVTGFMVIVVGIITVAVRIIMGCIVPFTV